MLAGDGIDEGLADVGVDAGLKRLDHRGVDAERDVGDRLDELDCGRQHGRLVGERYAGIHIEHVRTGGDLGERIGLHPAEVARAHLLCEHLAARRIDAFADHDERTVEADDCLARRGADDGVGHDAVRRVALPPVGAVDWRAGGSRLTEVTASASSP